MTELKKKVTRTVPGLTQRGVVVTLYPGGVLGFRESRMRQEYTLPVMWCYRKAIEFEMAEQARAKARARKEARAARKEKKR